jgi:hypothetical protein
MADSSFGDPIDCKALGKRMDVILQDLNIPACLLIVPEKSKRGGVVPVTAVSALNGMWLAVFRRLEELIVDKVLRDPGIEKEISQAISAYLKARELEGN